MSKLGRARVLRAFRLLRFGDLLKWSEHACPAPLHPRAEQVHAQKAFLPNGFYIFLPAFQHVFQYCLRGYAWQSRKHSARASLHLRLRLVHRMRSVCLP